jgi:phage terminase Nu1 subunit (DNA packaging protein)
VELNALTATESAKLLGVSLRQLSYMVQDGLPRKHSGKKVRYDWGQVCAWKESKSNGQQQTDDQKLSIQQARKYSVDAERAELKLRKERGDLVSVKDVTRALIQSNAIIRAKLLGIPTKLAPRLSGRHTTVEIKAILQTEIYEVLRELAATAGNVE